MIHLATIESLLGSIGWIVGAALAGYIAGCVLPVQKLWAKK